MAYRREKKKKPVKRVFQDMTTRNISFVQNGVTAYFAIPCWYQEIRHPQHTHLHDREWHDHLGWPDPKRPDASCQNAYVMEQPPYLYNYEKTGWESPERYLDMSTMFPIHLLEEGYTDVEVAFVDPPSGLVGTGYMDEDSDWVVRFIIEANCADALTENVDVSYAVFVNGIINGRKRRDVVAKGTLRILAGPTA